MDGISFKSPILKAIKLKECVAKVGFDWDDANGVMAKVDEEVEEIKMAIKNKDEENTEEEIGDALFVLVNLADKLKINPELALNKANKKFERRFRAVEEKMKKACIPLKKENLAQMEAFWQEVKKGEHDRDSNL